MKVYPQLQKIFFDEGSEPSHEEKLSRVGLGNNPKSPFNRFIGNAKEVYKLQVAAYTALGKPNHKMRELNFAIIGPSSAGKTTLAKIYAESVELPILEVSPKSIVTLEALFREIKDVLKENGIELVECGEKYYILPPMIIFVDEVHAVSPSMIQGLLKPVESKDCIMALQDGTTIDTENVTWMIATTESGKLFGPFKNRFSEVSLKYLKKSDIAKIIKLDHPEIPDDICHLISHYKSRIPRKALEFTSYVKMMKEMTGQNWEDAVKQAAENEGIDEYGMPSDHLKILKALAERPVAKNRIGLITGVNTEEIENFTMPWLLTETEDQPPLVQVTHKGYAITEQGREQLKLRGI